jgi:hypothetical protein
MEVILRNDESGCTRKDCKRASRCVRYLGALERTTSGIMRCWIWVPDPEKCTEFWEVKNAEKSA